MDLPPLRVELPRGDDAPVPQPGLSAQVPAHIRAQLRPLPGRAALGSRGHDTPIADFLNLSCSPIEGVRSGVSVEVEREQGWAWWLSMGLVVSPPYFIVAKPSLSAHFYLFLAIGLFALPWLVLLYLWGYFFGSAIRD